MTRKEFFGSLAGVAAPYIGGQARRNVVLIVSDDHAFNMLCCAGHPWVRTPSLDRMARNGAHFRNAFVTTSLCCPSRASILSGRYAHSHGVDSNYTDLPAGIATFPQLLREAGHRTAFIGKWHMDAGNDAPRPGFDHWVSFKGQGEYFDPLLNVDGVAQRAQGYTTDLLTEYALRFIAGAQAQPFCLILSHTAPHAFCQSAPRHRDLYQNEPIPYPASMANTEENYRGKPDWVRRQRNSWHGVDGMYDKALAFDAHYREYCRALAAVDESVGSVLDTLDANGLADSTLVLYLGDNGFMFGDHGLIDKRAMYDPSIRIPLLAQCPELLGQGRTAEQLALNIDVAPTILEAAGVKAPAEMQGRSLLAMLRGEEWRRSFVYEYFWDRVFPHTPSVLGLRTERYTYARYHGVWDMNELYDNAVDPDQGNNLIGDVRVTTQAGPLVERIRDPQLQSFVRSMQDRITDIVLNTGGRPEPSWEM
jgi:N-acetylglucosamine-6-sulfatase